MSPHSTSFCSTRGFYDRLYRVLGAERFTTALLERITNPKVRHLPMTGAIDQFVDSTNALGDLRLLRATIAAQLHGADLQPTG